MPISSARSSAIPELLLVLCWRRIRERADRGPLLLILEPGFAISPLELLTDLADATRSVDLQSSFRKLDDDKACTFAVCGACKYVLRPINVLVASVEKKPVDLQSAARNFHEGKTCRFAVCGACKYVVEDEQTKIVFWFFASEDSRERCTPSCTLFLFLFSATRGS